MGTAALDIGGTAIKSGIWTGIKDEIKEVRETPTNARLGGAHVVEQAVKILESYHGFDAIGISTAGQVDSQRYAMPMKTFPVIREWRSAAC